LSAAGALPLFRNFRREISLHGEGRYVLTPMARSSMAIMPQPAACLAIAGTQATMVTIDAGEDKPFSFELLAEAHFLVNGLAN
jgi:hypothetical protein